MSDDALTVVEEAIEALPLVMPHDRRFLDAKDAKVAVEEGGNSPILRGYAAVFNQKSTVLLDNFRLGPYREMVMPGAFKRSLTSGADVVALWQHRDEWPLARKSAGTLTLQEDDYGLRVEMHLGDTSWARDAYNSVKSGLVKNMSFRFQQIRWDDDLSTKPLTRKQLEMGLLEVSPVTFPAYPETSIGARNLLASSGLDVDALSRVLVRARRGDDLRRYERDLIDEFHDLLSTLRSSADPATGHSAEPEASPDPAEGHSAQTSDEQAPTPARAASPSVDPAVAARLKARLAAVERL